MREYARNNTGVMLMFALVVLFGIGYYFHSKDELLVELLRSSFFGLGILLQINPKESSR